MENNKTFINGIFIKEQKFTEGSILKLSVNAETLIEEIKKYANADGWVNIDLKAKRTPDEKGRTHYAELNKWKPTQEQLKNLPQTKEEEIKVNNIPF